MGVVQGGQPGHSSRPKAKLESVTPAPVAAAAVPTSATGRRL